MNEYVIYLLVVLGGLVTFAIRISFLFFLGRGRISPLLEDVLRYIPPAAFAALAVPAVLSPAGTINLGPDNLRLVAALAAVAVGIWTRNMVWMLVCGMAVLWTLTYLAG